MQEFTFKISQPATTFFEGDITISARNKQSAIKKIKNLKQAEIENLAKNWELADSEADTSGNIEVWDDYGNQINEL